MIKTVTAVVTLVTLIVFYMTFDLASMITIVGICSIALFVMLEVMTSVSTESKYIWKTDKTTALLKGSSTALFSMTSAIFLINSMV